jgi:putative SOS response-associated peptidase YedK
MPVILAGGAESAWLERSQPPDCLRELLIGLSPSETALRPVGSAVNDARYDGPDCLEPPIPDGQVALF